MLRNTWQLKKKFPPIYLGLAKALWLRQKNSQSGLTLLEAMVAIVMITAVISAITPPIFLSVATRVQNRRAQQAQHLANGAVDRVRRLVATRTYNKDDIDRVVPVTVSGDIRQAEVPAKDDHAQLVDFDGDKNPDFRVQVFRTTDGEAWERDIEGKQVKPVIFTLGVRVYFVFPDPKDPTKLPTLLKERASLKMTSGMSWQDDKGRIRPLAVAYTQVALSDSLDGNALCYFGESQGKKFEEQCPPN